MKNTTEIRKPQEAKEQETAHWLYNEVQEDDFLLGKVSEFSPDTWEDDE